MKFETKNYSVLNYRFTPLIFTDILLEYLLLSKRVSNHLTGISVWARDELPWSSNDFRSWHIL